MATTKGPDEGVPEDLKDLMCTLQNVGASDRSYRSRLIKICAPAMIFVARRVASYVFPKLFARAIVRELEPLRLWDITRGVDGLNVVGIDGTRITNDFSSRDYLWTNLDARTPNAADRFIEPQVFSRILKAYEEQLKETRRPDPTHM
jgi:hypothetical protein